MSLPLLPIHAVLCTFFSGTFFPVPFFPVPLLPVLFYLYFLFYLYMFAAYHSQSVLRLPGHVFDTVWYLCQ